MYWSPKEWVGGGKRGDAGLRSIIFGLWLFLVLGCVWAERPRWGSRIRFIYSSSRRIFPFLRVPILIHPFLLSLFYFNYECYFCYNYYYCCFLFLEVTSYTSSLGFEASHTPRRKEPLSVEIFISLELLIYFLLLYKFFIYVIVVGLNVDGLGIPEHILL